MEVQSAKRFYAVSKATKARLDRAPHDFLCVLFDYFVRVRVRVRVRMRMRVRVCVCVWNREELLT